MSARRPVMLVILDGFGWREERADNAVRQAKTPAFTQLWESCPHAFLHPSGRDVGLPEGQMGNSEVGHLNIGAGRVVMQDLPRISDAIAKGELGEMAPLKRFIDKLKASKGTCHLMGLVSPGGVHSHQDHGAALAEILSDAGVPTRVHVFTDGRDTPPRSGAEDVRRLAAALPKDVSIATVIGRYYAMDRDNRWERVSRAYDAIVLGEGGRADDAVAAVEASYRADKGDEFVEPVVIGGYGGARDGDGVLCFNFRADRVRELLAALLEPAFKRFERKRVATFAAALGLTHFSDELAPLMDALFPQQNLTNVLGKVVSDAGLAQARLAETEKFPHVTYFLNGGEETPYPGEDRIMVPSPKVATYDLQPEMSAPELTDKAVAAIDSVKYALLVLNFANPDMVGHSGSLPAAIKAVEAADAGLGRIVAALKKQNGALIVTADHGNCELMRDPATGGPHTAHTTNPVPVVVMGSNATTIHDGRLADLAPTLLALLSVKQPNEMTGRSLVDE